MCVDLCVRCIWLAKCQQIKIKLEGSCHFFASILFSVSVFIWSTHEVQVVFIIVAFNPKQLFIFTYTEIEFLSPRIEKQKNHF